MHTPEELRKTWEKFCGKRVAKFVTQKSVSFAQFSLFIWNPEDESSPCFERKENLFQKLKRSALNYGSNGKLSD